MKASSNAIRIRSITSPRGALGHLPMCSEGTSNRTPLQRCRGTRSPRVLREETPRSGQWQMGSDDEVKRVSRSEHSPGCAARLVCAAHAAGRAGLARGNQGYQDT